MSPKGIPRITVLETDRNLHTHLMGIDLPLELVENKWSTFQWSGRQEIAYHEMYRKFTPHVKILYICVSRSACSRSM